MNRQQLLTMAKRALDERKRNAEIQCDEVLAQLRSDKKWNEAERALRQAEVDFVMNDGQAKKVAQKQIAKCKAKLDKIWQKKD